MGIEQSSSSTNDSTLNLNSEISHPILTPSPIQRHPMVSTIISRSRDSRTSHIDSETSIIPEAFPRGHDQRRPVRNTTIHPYNAIGKLIAYFTITTSGKKIKEYTHNGTAFFITQKHILTAAHTLCIPGYHQNDLKPKKILFFPEPLNRNQNLQNGIPAEIIHLDKHQRCKKKEQLKISKAIPKQIALKCIFNYSSTRYPLNLINIAGYPSENQRSIIDLMAGEPIQNLLCHHEDKIQSQYSNGILSYKHSTSYGTSGAPLLMKLKDNESDYRVIGLHLDERGNRKQGILLSQCILKNEIFFLIIIQQLISRHSQNSNIQDSQLSIQSDEQLMALATYQSILQNAQSISFRIASQFCITEEGLKALAENGQKFKKLQEIHLSKSKITDEGFMLLAKNGDNFKNLKNIDFHGNEIGDKGLKELAQNGDKFKSLLEINLSYNKIADQGLQALAKQGQKFEILKKIHLEANKILDKGLISLAENGDKFKSLQKFNLKDNHITDEGLKKLVINGNKFKQLRQINLINWKISEQGLKALSDNIKKFRSLTTIVISKDKLTKKMIQACESDIDEKNNKEINFKISKSKIKVNQSKNLEEEQPPLSSHSKQPKIKVDQSEILKKDQFPHQSYSEKQQRLFQHGSFCFLFSICSNCMMNEG